jgi:hypothetical protein
MYKKKKRSTTVQPFARYLNDHDLDALTVAIQAKVRYLTVWNAMKGNPITPDHSQKIRHAVIALTGIPFTGSFVIIPGQAVD